MCSGGDGGAGGALYSPTEETDAEGVLLSVVTSLWESCGVQQPRKLLTELGFDGHRLRLNALLDCMEEEIVVLCGNLSPDNLWGAPPALVLFRAALCLHRHELDQVRAALERALAERNKLRADLVDANRRAVVLAQDVDENHSRLEMVSETKIKYLEQKHSEALQQLTLRTDAEKESNSRTVSDLEKRVIFLQNEESKLKSRLDAVRSENERLERDNDRLQDRSFETSEINKRLSREIELLTANGRHCLDEYRETTDATIYEDKILELKQENTALRDRNDELSTELECANRTIHKYESTNALRNVEDDCDGKLSTLCLGNGVKRRGLSQCELVSEEESPRISKVRKCHDAAAEDNENLSETQLFKDYVMNGLLDKYSDCSGRLANDVSHDGAFDVHFSADTLENILQRLKEQNCTTLLKIINQTKYKHYYLAFYYLLHEIKNDIDKIPIESSISEETITDLDNLTKLGLCLNEMNVLNLECFKNNDKLSIDMKESNIVNKLENTNAPSDESFLLNFHSQNESLIDELKSQIANLEKTLNDEKATRQKESDKNAEKCQELESNLESLRAVYEESEDYWASKLKEEREMFEQEQQMSDEKFSDLMNKLAEYEEQFATNDNKTEFYHRPLSTIDEKCSLEKQFTDLEDEFQEYKSKIQSEIKEKDNEIQCLQMKILSFEQKQEEKFDDKKLNTSQIDLTKISDNFNNSNILSFADNNDSNPIASPIEYLWSQKTISSPLNNNKLNDHKVRDYQNPTFLRDSISKNNLNMFIENTTESNANILSNYETSLMTHNSSNVEPIQKPILPKTTMIKNNVNCNYVNCLDKKLEGKILHCADLEQALQGRNKHVQEQENVQIRLKPDISSYNAPRLLSQQDDSNARAILEHQCRQLHSSLLQQQAIYQQTLAVHRGEIGAIKQKLAAADLLIRDLYVENCHLTENIINSPLL